MSCLHYVQQGRRPASGSVDVSACCVVLLRPYSRTHQSRTYLPTYHCDQADPLTSLRAHPPVVTDVRIYLLAHRLTLVVTGLWIVWAPVLWGLCYLLLRRRARRALRAEGYP